VKKIIKIFVFAAVLFAAAGTGITYPYGSYAECRCNQATPGSGVNIVSDCCANNWGGYGNDNDSRCCSDITKTWVKARKTCLTPCLCLGTQSKLADYQEDIPSGKCCGSAPVGGGGITPTPSYVWQMSYAMVNCKNGGVANNGLNLYPNASPSNPCPTSIATSSCNLNTTGYCENQSAYPVLLADGITYASGCCATSWNGRTDVQNNQSGNGINFTCGITYTCVQQ